MRSTNTSAGEQNKFYDALALQGHNNQKFLL